MNDCVGRIEYSSVVVGCGAGKKSGACQYGPFTRYVVFEVLHDTVPGWMTLPLARNSSDRGHTQETEVFY